MEDRIATRICASVEKFVKFINSLRLHHCLAKFLEFIIHDDYDYP